MNFELRTQPAPWTATPISTPGQHGGISQLAFFILTRRYVSAGCLLCFQWPINSVSRGGWLRARSLQHTPFLCGEREEVIKKRRRRSAGEGACRRDSTTADSAGATFGVAFAVTRGRDATHRIASHHITYRAATRQRRRGASPWRRSRRSRTPSARITS